MSDWLDRARRAASVGPSRDRARLFLQAEDAAHEIGSIEPEIAEAICAAGLLRRRLGGGYDVETPGERSLAAIAHWLHEHKFITHWRGELVGVADAAGRVVAAIERSAVRPLGIATAAVHLVGIAEGGERLWVQQRAFDKATDPGLWDTLMGGLVAAGESIAMTLERETMEEAGLPIGTLRQLEAAAPIFIRRPVADGYMIERIDVFRAVVPGEAEPVNRDGEVERFECIDESALAGRLRDGAFTLEATLILGAELERRGRERATP